MPEAEPRFGNSIGFKISLFSRILMENKIATLNIFLIYSRLNSQVILVHYYYN